MMSYAQYIYFIPLLPFLSFVLLGIFGKKTFARTAGMIAVLLMLASTGLSLYAASQYFFVDGQVGGIYHPIEAMHFTWLRFTENISIDMGIILDPISVMMLVVVNFVSLMVHVFSLGYMKGEERFSTYFSFLGLFTFSMLGLVLASNLFQVYMFWELVGVSSYLLIGFYFQKPTAVAAAKKAFIVTRFADLGFLIGILLLAYFGESLDIQILIHRLTDIHSPQVLAITTASFAGLTAFTWALALVFMGGAGKSAMFPLHIWLPDAMEGPTPVSALIHAATMVVAGVYLVARLFPLFSINEAVLHLVSFVGALSAVVAAVIACTQTDIKRVLAYSTMSQIGYMMFALGVARNTEGHNLGFTASMFHLFTHAFFKSLLFLCAGVIIHVVHSNEMKDMGGLRKKMPLTHIAFLIACLSIAGIIPFSGFFSKEEILLAAFQENKIVYAVALATSGLTAFYMFRLYFSIFWRDGERPTVSETHLTKNKISEAIPLACLAILTIAAGFAPFGKFVSADGHPIETGIHWNFSILPLVVGVACILLAMWMYKKNSQRPARLAKGLGFLYQLSVRKFYVDELYLFITKKILFNLVARPAAWIDRHVVDGLMNGIAETTATASSMIKGLQSGKVQAYTLYFFGGLLAMAIVILYWWK
jgi:NADH-quinone oxidoreductase subunit L